MKVCSICGEKKKIVSNKNDISVCHNCYGKINKEECSLCHKLKCVNVRKDNKPICQECNRKKDFCSICKKYKIIKYKDMCGSCRAKERLEICSNCGNLSSVSKRNGLLPICSNCYGKIKKEKCSICKKEKFVKARKNNLAICEACNKRSKIGICNICNKKLPLNNTIEGKKVCTTCYHKNNLKKCIRCGKIKQVALNNEEGYICQNCYRIEKIRINTNYMVRNRIRDRVRSAIRDRKFSKNVQIYKSFYINFDSIINYLGPCPGNINEYHIDHIFPLSAFDLSNIIEFKIACCPENFQWLKAIDNIRKGSFYNFDDFINFKKFVINKYNF